MKRNKEKSAFTFTEVMIGIAITSLIGLAIFKLVSHARATSAKANCRGALRLSVQTAARQLERDIASSRAKLEDGNAGQQRRHKMTLTAMSKTGPTVVSMEVPIDDEPESSVTYFDSNTGSEDNLYEKVTYSLNGGVLKREGSKRGIVKVADNIKSVEFEVDEINAITQVSTTYDGKVRFVITAAARPDGQPDEMEHKQEVIVAIRQLQNKLKDGEQSTWRQRVNANDF